LCKIEPNHFHLNQNPYKRLLSDFNGNDKIVEVDHTILIQLHVAADFLQQAFKYHDFVFACCSPQLIVQGGLLLCRNPYKNNTRHHTIFQPPVRAHQ
jgi:hypothetical protein